MADYQAVFAVGDALARYLNNAYDATTVGFPCTFKLVSSAEIANENTTKLDKTISLFLHRMTTAEHYRNVTRLQDSPREQPVITGDVDIKTAAASINGNDRPLGRDNSFILLIGSNCPSCLLNLS